MGPLLRLISLVVPRAMRPRWLEEWRAELPHGRRRMILGALPDAWALRKLDGVPSEGGRRRSHPFHALDQDVRYALRTFATGKSFTLAVIGSLAIGIGATTAAFALVNAAFFRPFVGVEDQDRLVQVKIGDGGVWYPATWDEYERLRSDLTTLELAASYATDLAVSPGEGEPAEHAGGAVVSGNYFNVLGTRPAHGRFFAPDEDATPWARPAAVISHRLWQRQFASDPDVTGRTIIVNGTVLSIVGVAPEGFINLPMRADVDVWMTFAVSDLVFRDRAGRPTDVRQAGPVRIDFVGRLLPSVELEQAAAHAAVAGEGLIAARATRSRKGTSVRVEPLADKDAATYAFLAVAAMAVPLIVLAIACVNAASLLLARATRRSADWLVRLALGASRWRLVRQLLVESLLLALGGAALGIVLCYWMIGLWSSQAVLVTPSLAVLVDVKVMLFTLAAAGATAIVFGLGPALSVTRAAITRAPEAGRFLRGPFGSRTRAALVTLQAALCLGLLATGAQFTSTLQKSLADDNLQDPASLLSASLDVEALSFTEEETRIFYEALLERVRSLPGVESAALTGPGDAYLMGGVESLRVWRSWEGSDVDRSEASLLAGGDFFESMRLPILRGRSFSADDRKGPPRVVVVNQAFADSLSGGDPVGQMLRIAPRDGDYVSAADVVVVGVVPSPVFSRGHTIPIVYVPSPLAPAPARNLLVRFAGEASGSVAAVRSALAAVDNRVPLEQIATGDQLRRQRNASEIDVANRVSILGMLALILAAAGLYGVVSYMVTLREKEIGIRMALGAAGGSVLRLIVRQSIVPVLVGCALGAAGAVAAGALIRSRLYGVSPVDPVAFGGATLLLLLTMLIASLIPARHASRVDPITVLRQE
jgi:putative ABC transport system permease protein